MRKRGKQITQRLSAAPTLVAIYNQPEVAIKERMAVELVTLGTASTSQFNILLDCADLLLLSSYNKDSRGEQEICHFAREALQSIADSFDKTKRIGATGDEINVLRVLVNTSDDWWKRQSGAHYVEAHRALDSFRDEQQKRKKAAYWRSG